MEGSAFWKWFIEGGHVLINVAVIFLSAGIHFALSRRKDSRLAVELLLMYSIGVTGFKSIFGGFGMHFFFADEMAASIGWPSGNPFQMEVAFFNLAVGLLGALGFFRRDFWLPFIIVSTIAGWGAAYVHIQEISGSGNFQPNNAGPILYADLLMPILRIGLYALYRKNSLTT